MQTNNIDTADYDEKRVGFALRAGYDFNDHLRQGWTYSLVGRTVYNVAADCQLLHPDQAGYTLLSQVGQA